MACFANLPMISSPNPNPNPNLKASASLSQSSISTKLHFSSQFSSLSPSPLSLRCNQTLILRRFGGRAPSVSPTLVVVASANPNSLKIMISGAPASGKGTQCELITKKYDMVHIAAGDLLRAEVAAGSENGRRAKEFMEKGKLVPNEIVVMMVRDRLLQPDSQEKGWLLDGYPRSQSQATALKEFGFEPDLFILLEVPEEILVERVVGRRLDPVTGRIYHLKYSPPENEEIAARLTQRFDDTEEKVKLRLRATRPLGSKAQEYVTLKPKFLSPGQHGPQNGNVEGCLPKGFRRSSAPSRYVNYHVLGSTVCSTGKHMNQP